MILDMSSIAFLHDLRLLAPLLAGVLFVATALVWPTWAGWRRTGVFPVVFTRRSGAGLQRLVGALMGLLVLGLLVALGWRAWAGPASLGEWTTSPLFSAMGWTLVSVGWVLILVAQRQMAASWRIGIDDRPTALVTNGVFRRVRNPIFTGMLTTLAGFFVVAPAWWSLASWLAAVVLIRYQVQAEERHLAKLHGETYARYAALAGRFIPGVGRGVAGARRT